MDCAYARIRVVEGHLTVFLGKHNCFPMKTFLYFMTASLVVSLFHSAHAQGFAAQKAQMDNMALQDQVRMNNLATQGQLNSINNSIRQSQWQNQQGSVSKETAARYDMSRQNPDGSWDVRRDGSFYKAPKSQNQKIDTALTEQRIPDRSAIKKEEEKKLKAARDKSVIDVTRCYPQSLQKGDPLNLKVVELWETLVEQKNPIINDPDASFIVYSIAAEMLGVKPLMPR